jgi:hypothetical protein
MYQRPTAPRSIGGVLDDAVRLYRASARGWWLPSLLSALGQSWLTFYILRPLGGAAANNPQLAGAAMLARVTSSQVILASAGFMVVIIYFNFVVLSIQTAIAAGTPIPMSQAFARGLRALPRGIVAMILQLLAMAGGLILLVIPGLYVGFRLYLWPAVLTAERCGAGQSLRRSWTLMGGHWWRSSTTLFVIFVLALVFSVVIDFCAGLVGRVVHGDATVVFMISLGAGLVARTFIAALSPAATVAIYHDLLLRLEGSDLEARVSALS